MGVASLSGLCSSGLAVHSAVTLGAVSPGIRLCDRVALSLEAMR